MAIRQPLYSKEEFAIRGDKIYHDLICAQVEPKHQGKFVAIDI